MLSVAFHSYIQTPLLFHTCSGQRPQERRSITKENLLREGSATFCGAGTFISQVYTNVFTYKLPEVFGFEAKALNTQDLDVM